MMLYLGEQKGTGAKWWLTFTNIWYIAYTNIFAAPDLTQPINSISFLVDYKSDSHFKLIPYNSFILVLLLHLLFLLFYLPNSCHFFIKFNITCDLFLLLSERLKLSPLSQNRIKEYAVNELRFLFLELLSSKALFARFKNAFCCRIRKKSNQFIRQFVYSFYLWRVEFIFCFYFSRIRQVAILQNPL